MGGEVELNEQNAVKSKGLVKPGLRKMPANHVSVDDMEFDDQEYVQLQVRDEIKNKHKKLREENERLEAEEKKRLQEELLAKEEEEEEEAQDEEDNDEEDDSDERVSSDSKSEFQNENWIPQFESVCSKLNKKLIDLKQFTKSIRALMVNLDPAKDENNKKRLCLLTEHLIDYYQSLFSFKSTNASIDFRIVNECTNFIYELISKYGSKSTRQEPSMFIGIFNKILTELNESYVSLKWNEKKFPQLSIVSLLT